MAVYFITAREVGRVKIGFAQNAWKRFKKIQSDSPCEVSIEAMVEGNIATEQALHAHFAEYRVRREWFALCPEIEELIAHNPFARPPRALSSVVRDAPEGSVEWLVQRFGNASEMARRLNVPITTVATWRKKNRIPHYRRAEVERAAEAAA